MQFGVQFFPDVRPEERGAQQYFREALDIAEEADRLGFSHIRIVEHYFHYYGGYSPNPIVFLAAVAQRARFREGVEQVDLLLRRESVSHPGRFHSIENTTSLPRPTQLPRPKFYVAALNTLESFDYAGRMGYSVMAIAFVADKMRPLLSAYRQAWRAAGHRGDGEVMIAFHMFCDRDGERARAIATPLIDSYLGSLVDAASDWLDGRTSQDYPGYDKVIAGLRASNAADQMESGAAWIGTPDEIAATIARMNADFGGFEHASLQVNFNLMPSDAAMQSMRLFASEVMPRFAD